MLFLYRPRETWMPFRRPMSGTAQAAYNRQLQAKFASTRRSPPPLPAGAPATPLPPGAPRDVVAALSELAALHRAGEVSDAEFERAKAKVLAS